VLIAFFLLKQRFKFSHLAFSMTITSLILSLAAANDIRQDIAIIPREYYEIIRERNESSAVPLVPPLENEVPDIYYIVLDAYANSETLLEFYGYDNSEFVDLLEAQGFIVPKNIYANYPRTALSVASTTNMEYWDALVPEMDKVRSWWPTKHFLEKSIVQSSLEEIGYTTISFANDWGLTNNKNSSIYLQPYPILLTNIEDYLIRATPLRLLQKPLQNIMPIKTHDVHRHFIRYNLETLKEIPEMQGPKFVFSHIVFPHDPIVFDKDGNPIQTKNKFSFSSPEVTKDERQKLYIGQVEYINSQMKDVIKAILEKSSTPPIIIIQADHGLGLSMTFNPNENQCFQERLSIFGAYYLPGKNLDTLFQDYSSVNLFRIIFNEYFSTELALLENRFFFTQESNLFAGMQEITPKVKIFCDIE
jgi:hypothetical protein